MRIVNLTRQTVLAERAWCARRLGERLRGLLGRRGLDEGEGLFIEPCTSIHSFFMKFSFDAVFVDRQGSVLHVIEHMAPWRLSRWVPRAAGVIELPAGMVARTATVKGDRLKFEEAA